MADTTLIYVARGNASELPEKLPDLLAFLAKHLETVPSEFRANACFEFRSGGDYDPNEYEIYYYREKTAEELAQEARDTALRQTQSRAYDIQMALNTLKRNGVKISVT